MSFITKPTNVLFVVKVTSYCNMKASFSVRACVHACLHACLHACVHACVHACNHACNHACCVCFHYLGICVSVCDACICVYVLVYSNVLI